MKLTLRIVSVVALALVVMELGFAYATRPVSPAALGTRRFADWQVGATRPFDMHAAAGPLAGLSDREQHDQLLDWTLYGLVASSGLSAAQLSQALADVPPLRQTTFDSVANYEFGVTRSRALDDGALLVLVPGDRPPAQQTDQLAQAADEYRKNQGQKPVRLLVFTYAFGPASDGLQVTRDPDVEGSSLYTAAASYTEMTVSTPGALNEFLGQVDDLTFAQLDAGGRLRLGGRTYSVRPSHRMAAEDVAALWKSDAGLLASARAPARSGAPVPSGSGFSLDPAYDFNALRTYTTEVAPLLHSFAASGRLGVDDAEIVAAEQGIERKDVVPWLTLQKKLETSTTGNPSVKALVHAELQDIDFNARYQQARYDGDLQGTEVGMVLFYTDLLAKLWAMDYATSTPDGIPDFRSMVAADLSLIYKNEQESLPDTRLWFGPRHKGFQLQTTQSGSKTTSTSLLLSRSATRLYAASSDPLEPGVEVAPNPSSAYFLGWWDDHFEEVARYEPQYERLNQIMKWSLVISWLNTYQSGDQLGFLRNVAVSNDRWFPDWARQQPDLRYTAWDQIHFYNRGDAGRTTESLPPLKSADFRQFGDIHWLEGGVSLGDVSEISHSTPLSEDLGQLLRRSDWEYTKVADGGQRLETVDHGVFEFSNLPTGEAAVKITPPAQVPMRAPDAEWFDTDLRYVFDESNTGVDVSVQAGDTGFGTLDIQKSSNGLDIGWASRELDAGEALARRWGRTGSLDAIALDPNVEAAIVLDSQTRDTYLVKMRASRNWVQLSRDGGGGPGAPSGPRLRVGDPDPGSQPIFVAPVPDARFGSLLPNGPVYLVVSRDSSAPAALVSAESAHGPPAGAPSVTLVFGDNVPVQVRVDAATGQAYVPLDQLRAASGDALGDLGGADLDRLRTVAGGDVPPAMGIGSGEQIAFEAELGAADHETLARELVEDQTRFRALVEAHLHGGLKKADALLDAGRNSEAVDYLDSLIAVHGRNPDLVFRRALAQLAGDTNPAAVLRALTDSPMTGWQEHDTFFDELNRRIAAARTPEQGRNMERVGSFGEWLYDQSVDPLLDGRPELNLNDGNFVLDFRLASNLDAAAASTGDVSFAGAHVYLQDSPALSNLDFAMSMERLHQELISRDISIFITLPRGDIAHFHPGTLDTPDGLHFHLVDAPDLTNATQASGADARFPSYRPNPSNQSNQPCPPDQTSCPSDNRVLVVVAGR